MTETITTDIEVAAERMLQLGYERDEFIDLFHRWVERGDDILVFSNHDLGSIGSRMLGMAMPWVRTDPTPPHGPDGAWGLGWRYLVDIRVTAEE